jgi:hypothetical protein
MTKSELLTKMSSYEISEWQALWSLRSKEYEERRKEAEQNRPARRGWSGTLGGGKK